MLNCRDVFIPEDCPRLTREIELEAAMCAWEHKWQDNGSWEHGAGMLRMCCGSLAKAIHIGFHLAGPDYPHGSYDWDFVPWFLDNCVIWDNERAYIHGCPDLVDDWEEKCRKHGLPSDETLLRKTLDLLNKIPNQEGSYELAATISKRLS